MAVKIDDAARRAIGKATRNVALALGAALTLSACTTTTQGASAMRDGENGLRVEIVLRRPEQPHALDDDAGVHECAVHVEQDGLYVERRAGHAHESRSPAGVAAGRLRPPV